MALLVEQEVIFHTGEFAGLQCKPFDGRDPLNSALVAKSRQFAQRRDLIDAESCRRSEKRQLMESGPALTNEGMCPPHGMIIGVGAISIEDIDACDHFLGGRCQLIKAQPRCHKRSWWEIVRGLHIPLKVSEPRRSVYSRSGSFCSIRENPHENH